MKWYFASRTRHRERIALVAKFLESKGQTINSDWIYAEGLIPYEENIERTQEVGLEITKALLETEVFVLVSDPEGTDMFVELGVCLGKKVLNPEHVQIYIIGDHAKRSLMQLHPLIVHAPTLKEVFDIEKIDSSDFEIPDFT